jgi:hypothetical protein
MKKYLLISFSLAVFSFSNLYGQKSKLYFRPYRFFISRFLNTMSYGKRTVFPASAQKGKRYVLKFPAYIPPC